MTLKQNLHTHSVFCDGNDTIEEIIISAIDKGFSSIGFSSHSYVEDATYHTLTPDTLKDYKREICALKQKYADKIKVYCGIEQDIESPVDSDGFDFTIGAVHTLKLGGKLYDVDWTAEKTKDIINNFFSGDGLKYAKVYYERLAQLPKYGDFDILAHFDLIAKFNEITPLFDEESDEYKSAVLETVRALAGKIPYFEVNTGAISRGYRKTPYPSPFIIKELKKSGFGAVVTTDCHNKDFLDCGMRDADRLLRECGFREKFILSDNGFKAVPLV